MPVVRVILHVFLYVQLLQVLPVSATPSDREQNAGLGNDPHISLHGSVFNHPFDLFDDRLPQLRASESRLFDADECNAGLYRFLSLHFWFARRGTSGQMHDKA